MSIKFTTLRQFSQVIVQMTLCTPPVTKVTSTHIRLVLYCRKNCWGVGTDHGEGDRKSLGEITIKDDN